MPPETLDFNIFGENETAPLPLADRRVVLEGLKESRTLVWDPKTGRLRYQGVLAAEELEAMS